MLVSDNLISGPATGIQITAGVSTKYRGNLTIGATTPYSGGTNAGDNN